MNKITSEPIVKIDELSHDGRGVATINSKKTFIYQALAHEKVTYDITLSHTRYNEGKSIKILESSPDRVIPPCQHFGLCGGCSLQHMSTEAQLAHKQKTLLDHLKHFGNVIPELMLKAISANSLGYRRKARLGVKFVTKKNKVLVGFREKKSSRYLADLDQCKTLHPLIGTRLSELGELVASLTICCSIPQIEVAMGDNDLVLIFRHLTALSEKDANKLIEFGKKYNFYIYLQANSPAPLLALWPNDHKGEIAYSLPDHNLELFFHPLDFTQINLEMNRLMVQQALDLLDLKKNEKVLDLFCGIGNFTLPLAKYAKHVTGVENSKQMVQRARENAKYNGIANVDVQVSDLMKPSLASAWINSEYQKILLDPPRAGAKEIISYISKFSAQRIAYISCNTATLARDAGELVHHHGYRLAKAGILNMFPHTSHIEAMAIFEKI